MELTKENLDKVMVASLYEDHAEDISDQIEVQAIAHSFCFCPSRLEGQRQNIIDMLKQLDSAFMRSGGGGMSFLRLPFDAYGRQWGEQREAEVLMALGMAIGVVSYLFPRELWRILPGGVPYIVVDTDQFAVGE